jgi:hypothetical protein
LTIRFKLSARDNHDIVVASPEPLYLEYALTAGGEQGFLRKRSSAVNGTPAVSSASFDCLRRSSAACCCRGVVSQRRQSHRVKLRRIHRHRPTGRALHNYYGIAPTFRGLFGVADEAVNEWWKQQSPSHRHQARQSPLEAGC